jgi:hypothetical protein
MSSLARIAPWVFSVLILACAVSAAAGVKRRSAARCVRYGQKMDAAQSGVDLRLDNRCAFAVACSVRWDLVCAGAGPSPSSSELSLQRGQAQSVHASASACDGDWEVANVRWSCEPVRAP